MLSDCRNFLCSFFVLQIETDNESGSVVGLRLRRIVAGFSSRTTVVGPRRKTTVMGF